MNVYPTDLNRFVEYGKGMAETFMLPVKKKILDNGTITIPLEIRNSLGLQIGDEILVMIPVDQKSVAARAED